MARPPRNCQTGEVPGKALRVRACVKFVLNKIDPGVENCMISGNDEHCTIICTKYCLKRELVSVKSVIQVSAVRNIGACGKRCIHFLLLNTLALGTYGQKLVCNCLLDTIANWSPLRQDVADELRLSGAVTQ
ncbi:hypothetical protein T4B_5660 [Trichinella pseudospiralis]|uniref:Uncharacterized protein n=1 Tax=Trichinella pseudospiralis TaxID=6337 RepID=A0A0V1JW75_TRIPS|nr:hypothetical protein T4B_5660 [Trichinella pseudospiralis]KRZ39223.1 hypothetical protein T4C_12394 [Trichinella pseudospiralis]